MGKNWLHEKQFKLFLEHEKRWKAMINDLEQCEIMINDLKWAIVNVIQIENDDKCFWTMKSDDKLC